MTDGEALRTFLSTFASCFLTHDTEEREAACEYAADGFAAGLAHARQWRPLTEDPKTWPEVGWIVVWDARMPTRAKAGRVLSETGTELMRQGWTHWLPLPEPPKGGSDG